MNGKEVLLIAAPFSFEDPQKLIDDLMALALRHGVEEPPRIIDRPVRLKSIPSSTLILTDLPFRLAPDLPGVLAWLKAALDRGCEVLIPGTVDLRLQNPCLPAQKQVIEALAAFPKQMKAVNIKEGLQLARARGRTIGRKSLTPEQVEIARQAFAEAGSVRSAERLLRGKGHSVSRSAIHRIVQNKGKRHE